MEDKDLNHILNQYRVPVLDPDLVIQAVHNAIHAPQQDVRAAKLPQRRISFAALLNPFPSFVMGGMVAVAAMVLFVLPMLGLQIRHEFNVDSVLSDLTIREQVAENDVRNADEVFGLLEGPQNDSQQIEELLQDQPDETPIWDIFMDRG